MNKIVLQFLLIASFAFLFQSCQKYPSASFTTDLQEYTVGETIRLSNLSTDADSYLWTFPNGETSTLDSIQYIIPQNTPTGLQSIKLAAYSKNKKKIDEKTVYVTIKPSAAFTGSATFWLYGASNGSYANVTVQNVTKYITDYYYSEPSCQDSYCANFTNLNIGTYTYYATSSNKSWNGSFTVTGGNCIKIQLY